MTPLVQKRLLSARLALAMLLLLTACTFPSLGNLGKKIAPTAVPSGSAAETGGPESQDTPTGPAAQSTSTNGPDQPTVESAISAADFSDPNNLPHGLILFTSTSAQPFKKGQAGPASDTNGERYLWAISTDGKRAGQVSPAGSGAALFTANTQGKKSKVLQNGFKVTSEKIEAIDLPEECTQTGGQPCSGFQFSPSGSLLAYFSGADSCSRTLNLYGLASRKTVKTWANAHWAYFFNDGSLMISLGSCDSQFAYLYIPKTDKQAGVQKIGKAYWSPNHKAVVFQVQGKPELQAGLWGFNLETSRVFLWPNQETVIEDTPIWLADGENFVFQHQPYTYDKDTKTATLSGPRQIILMNAWTRSQRLLGFDSRSNYHLCSAADLPSGEPAGSPCDQPYGNWLRIQRLPFQPLHFPVANRDKPETRCALYGLDCKEQPELLALDWQNVKQYPWEEARIPEATATPGANRPDLNKDPFFQDPNGGFAFYLGKDGRTLWYVPGDREPALWVQDGEGFVYLP